MAVAALLVLVVICMFSFGMMSGRFVKALKEETPVVFESLGSPKPGFYIWNKRWLKPFSKLIVFHGYRSALVSFPKSRAWASWLFFVHWVQLIATIAIIVLVIFS